LKDRRREQSLVEVTAEKQRPNRAVADRHIDQSIVAAPTQDIEKLGLGLEIWP